MGNLQSESASCFSKVSSLACFFDCGVVEADLELFCNSWSAGFLGERLYARNGICVPPPVKLHGAADISLVRSAGKQESSHQNDE